ncbi:MAG: ATP-binding cassette domain-containing protein [Chloroflexi bacterium]|nr:MAG: ATP-binding cassette domain-containing protein [Chloroflexota bacterium]
MNERSLADDYAVVVEGLSFKYPVGKEDVLTDVSLRIRTGEFVGITGSSGAGKSTLCLCLRGLIPHAVSGKFRGNVAIAGRRTSDTSAAQLGEVVNLVFQDPEAQIIGLTVEEDLAFAPENYGWERDRIRERIPVVLEQVRLSGMERRETYSLSGGQKQRVAIASALMLLPQILILDEPTSELDPVGKEEVFATIKRLKDEQAMTIVVVEHAVEQLAEFADRIVVMDKGRIVDEGPPSRVFRNVDLFHRLEGERVPQVAEAFFLLEQRGLSTPDEFTPVERDAIEVLASRLGASSG